MSRNAEWTIFVDEVRRSSPPQIGHSAQKAIWHMRNKKRAALLIKVPIAGLLMMFIAFVALANTSSSFAKILSTIPVLRGIAKRMTGSPGLRSIMITGTKHASRVLPS